MSLRHKHTRRVIPRERPRAGQHRRLTLERLEERQLLAGDVFLVNFQVDGAFTPNRHVADTGDVFGARDGGLSYGWSSDHTDQGRERAIQPDQRLDTLVQFESLQEWEFQLPNGNYEVTASVGDPINASTHTLNVEKTSLFNAIPLSADAFMEGTVTVQVSDGRLTLDSGNAGPQATRINYVYIVGLPSGPNNPPSAPIIQEPTIPGQVVNPSDVHLEGVGFSDPNGDSHANTDWQIWTDDGTGQPDELVWTTMGIAGVERLHSHLGDGIFVNSHAGRADLEFDNEYLMRVRFRDSAGSVSNWSARTFVTGAATAAFPLSLQDIAATPVPTWVDGVGNEVVLPGPLGVKPALRVESATGELLLSISGNNGTNNTLNNPPPLSDHADTRITISGGSSGVDLQDTDLTVFDDDNTDHTIFLPAVTLAAGESILLWVAADGATYFGEEGQTTPDFSNLARSSVLGFVALEPGYRVEVAAEGLQLPVNMAFVPNPGLDPDDPLFYVTELYGQVKVILNNGTMLDYATGLLNFNPTGNFPGSGEQGVTGIVVEPLTGDVIISRVRDTDGLPGGDHHPQVVRLHSTDEGRASSGETVILDMPGETQGQSHQVSDISFGPDGKLYVHNGDGFDSSTALNLNSFRGKILRLNLNGDAPPDNPRYNALDGITATDYIYAYGFRNPFGGAWRAADDKLYEVENGPGSNDRFAQVNANVNYAWNGSAASLTTNAIYNWSPPHAPVDIAFVQPETFFGSGFPSTDQDMAFVTESGPTWATGPQTRGKRIVKFDLDATGNLISGPTPFVEYVGQGKASTAGIVAGPDGLYFTDLYPDLNFQDPTAPGARVLRVRFVGDNSGAANFTADQAVGNQPLTVQFSDQSTVIGATQWMWNFGDGITSEMQNPVHVYTTPGVYDVSLTVSSVNGNRSVTMSDHIVAGFRPEDTNLDGIVDQASDVPNFVAGWLSNTTGQTTLQKMQAGDNDLNGIVDLLDAFNLHRALLEAGQGALNFDLLVEPTPGDYDSDGDVDQDDYGVWKANFGATASNNTPLAGDGNADGIVDRIDYLIWRDHVTTTSGSAASAATVATSSEPGSAENDEFDPSFGQTPFQTLVLPTELEGDVNVVRHRSSAAGVRATQFDSFASLPHKRRHQELLDTLATDKALDFTQPVPNRAIGRRSELDTDDLASESWRARDAVFRLPVQEWASIRWRPALRRLYR